MDNLMYSVYLQIGPVIYQIRAEEPIQIHADCKDYVLDSKEKIEMEHCHLICCAVYRVSNFSKITGELVYQNAERMIFFDGKKESRLYGVNNVVYGIYSETEDSHTIKLELNASWISSLKIDVTFLEMLAVEKYLLEENALILHASFIKWQNKGIVFTAPSGTGKSTQAELWKIHADATILNGDRVILWQQPGKDTFAACGIPFCGSSGISRNETLPLNTIVFLRQAEKNTVIIPTQVDAFARLLEEISVNCWNYQAVLKSTDLILKLLKQVQSLQLCCNMKPDAVTTLQAEILSWKSNHLPR